MRRFIFLIVLAISATYVNGQQLPLYSQYMLNNFVTNPGIAGSDGYWTTKLTYRHQWLGFEGAPITQTLTAHGTLGNETNGVGAIFYNDIIGPTRKTGLNVVYAHHLELGDARLGIGLQGGIFQYNINGVKILTTTSGDNAIPEGSNNVIVPDAAFGLYLYSENYFVGLSAPQLIESQIKLSSQNIVRLSKLSRHYFLSGGYKYEVNRDLVVEPSIFVKFVAGAPLQVDLNTKMIFEEKYWVGLSYRSFAAISLMGGLTLNDNWNFGYAYDFTTTAIRNFNNGSHELVVGYDFIK